MPGSFGSLFLQVMLIYYYNKGKIARAAIDWLPLCEGGLRYHPLSLQMVPIPPNRHNIHLAQKYNKNFVKKTEKSA